MGEKLTADIYHRDADGMENVSSMDGGRLWLKYTIIWFSDYDYERGGGPVVAWSFVTDLDLRPRHVGMAITAKWYFVDDLGSREGPFVSARTAPVAAIVPGSSPEPGSLHR